MQNQNQLIREYVDIRLKSINAFFLKYKDETAISHAVGAFSPIPVNYQTWKLKHNDLKEEKEIGSGASAKVYCGVYIPTGEKVAIKKLSFPKLDGNVRLAFQRELSVLASTSHPTLLKFIGATETEPYCIVTEWVPNGSLYHEIHQYRRLSQTERTIVAYDIARGMAFMHSMNIIHRDLKSLNVLLDANNRAKICDFGFSRQADSAVMTMNIGTPHWMAPELLGEVQTGYDTKVDVYAYGIVLWELAAQAVPYAGMDSTQIIANVLLNDIRPQIPPETPRGLTELIRACWARDPEARPTFAQILKAFRKGTILLSGADPSAVLSYMQTNSDGATGDICSQVSSVESNGEQFEDFVRIIEERGIPVEEIDSCWDFLMRYKQFREIYARGLVVFLSTRMAIDASQELVALDAVPESVVRHVVDLLPTGDTRVDSNLVLTACRNGQAAKVAARAIGSLHVRLALEVCAQAGVPDEDLEMIKYVSLKELQASDPATVVSALRCLITIRQISAIPIDTIRKHMASGNITLRTAAHVVAAAMAKEGVEIPQDLVKGLTALSGSDPFASAVLIASASSYPNADLLVGMLDQGLVLSAEVVLKILANASQFKALRPQVMEQLKRGSEKYQLPETKRMYESVLSACVAPAC